jgi:hypothetical protein
LFFKAIVFLLNAPDKAIRIIIKRFGH